MKIPRLINARLREWASQPDHKPLILRGARQVGKTTAVRLFAAEFENFLEFNLERSRDRAPFEEDLPVPRLIEALFFLAGKPRRPGRTLLFLDEIQHSAPAIALLRYLHEEAPELHVIGAGSLLETMLDARQVSFPVGRVTFLSLYPLVFEEFLIALGETARLQCLEELPFPGYAEPGLFELFHRYALVGGMPAVVDAYRRDGDLVSLAPLYEDLLVAYMDDAVKYAPNPTLRAVFRHVIETAPLAAGRRIRFEGFGNSRYRSREVGEAFRALERAMLLDLLRPTTALALPLAPDLKKAPRLQFLDIGLVNHVTGLQESLLNIKDLTAVAQGMLAEQVVGQQLAALDPQSARKPVFWVRQASGANAELDFLLQHRARPVPVEVKAGPTGSLKSLHEFVDRSGVDLAVRLYAGSFRVEQATTPKGTPFRLLNLPYFLAGRIFTCLDRVLDGQC